MLRNSSSRAWALAAGAAFLSTNTELARAAQLEANWLGGVANWNNATFWDGARVPNNTAQDTFIARVDAALASASIVTLTSNVTIDALAIAVGDSVVISDSRQMTIVAAPGGGWIENAGLLTLASTGTNTTLRVSGGEVALRGGGVVSLGNASTNRITGAEDTDRLINENCVILGAGAIGANGMSLTNRGTILASGSAGLTIDPSAGGDIINAGLLQAGFGSALRINGGTVQNVGGIIEALDGGLIEFSGAVIVGGTVRTTGTGAIHTVGTEVLDGGATAVTNSGRIRVLAGDKLDFRGTLVNNGTVDLDSSGAQAKMRVDGTALLVGGGEVLLGDSGLNALDGLNAASLVNFDNTIRGAGSLGLNNVALENWGTLVADQPGGVLEIWPVDDGLTNLGTLRAETGATLRLSTGEYFNSGEIVAADDSIVELRGATIVGGTLRAEGTGVFQTFGTEVLDGLATPVVLDGDLHVRNSDDLELRGAIENRGEITIESTGATTELAIDGPVTLNGGGVILLADHASNRVDGTNGGALTNLDNTIRGGGALGFNTLIVENRATIVADAATPLIIDPALGGFLNSGTIRAQVGSVLRVVSGTIDNAGGDITAEGTVELDGATIAGGSIGSSGAGRIVARGNSTLDGVGDEITISGVIDVSDAADLALRGAIHNAGTINIASAGLTTELEIDGPVTLGGGGTIVLGDKAANRVDGVNAAFLTNEDNVIRGGGTLGGNAMGMLNEGEIHADALTALILDVNESGFVNEGLLRASSAAGLSIAGGGFTNAGEFVIETASQVQRTGSIAQTAGRTLVRGTLNPSDSVVLSGGELTGPGLVNNSVQNDATVAPGEPYGALSIGGIYTQGAGGRLAIDVQGEQAGITHDVLGISGSATLDGTLALDFSGLAQPAVGQRFVVLNASSISGRFASIEVSGLAAPFNVDVMYEGSTIAVVLGGSLSGGSSTPTDPAVEPPTTWGGIFVSDVMEDEVNENLVDQLRPLPWIAGVQLTISWSQIEPANDQYNWHLIDQELAAYDAIGRRVAFKFICVGGEVEPDDPLDPDFVYVNDLTPEWVLNDPGVATIGEIQTPFGWLPRYPVYWDAGYKAHLADFVKDFGDRYGQDARIEYFRMGGWQVGTNEPNFYAEAAQYLDSQIEAAGMPLDFDENGDPIVLAGSVYSLAILDMIDEYRAEFGSIPLIATIKFDPPGTYRDEMNNYCASVGLGMVNTGLNEGEHVGARQRFRDWHDNYGCLVGWGGLTSVGLKLTQAELDARGQTLYQVVMSEAVGIDDDPIYAPASRANYVVVLQASLDAADDLRPFAPLLTYTRD